QGRPHLRDRRDQEPRDLLRAPRRGRRRPERADRRSDRARLRLGSGLANRPQGDRDGRARLGLDRLRLGRGAPLQLRGRRPEHVPDLERHAADRARRLRARLLPRLPDRPSVLHRRVLRQPRLVDDQRLGVEVQHPEVGMDIRLRPLRDEELGEFVEASRIDYVEGLLAHARMPEEFARDKAEHDLAAYLGASAVAEGHSMYWIEESGERVGRLWFAERPSVRIGRLAWLYELEIDEPFRGQGYGRRALQLFEQ